MGGRVKNYQLESYKSGQPGDWLVGMDETGDPRAGISVGSLVKYFSLFREDSRQAAFGQVEERRELTSRVTSSFSSSLSLDQSTVGSHNHVHINLGLRVFFVAEVKQGRPFDNSYRGGCDQVFQGRLLQGPRFNESSEGEGKGDTGSGNCSGASSAVGLDDVAIEDDSPFAEQMHIDDRAQASADQALYLVRSAPNFASLTFSGTAGEGCSGQHRVFGRDPSAAGITKPAGTPFSMVALHRTLVCSTAMSTEPSAVRTKFGVREMGRS